MICPALICSNTLAVSDVDVVKLLGVCPSLASNAKARIKKNNIKHNILQYT